MPPKKAPASEEGSASGLFSNMTEGEMKFIKAMFDNMTQRPDANWEKVATDLGLKDAKCAKERFRQMSVKHGWRDSSANGPSPKKARTPAKPKSTHTKVTKPRTPRKSTKKFKSEAEVGVSDDDDSMQLDAHEEAFNDEYNAVKIEPFPVLGPIEQYRVGEGVKDEDGSSSELSEPAVDRDGDYQP